MTTFTGQNVQRNNAGEICDVHVVDEAGNKNTLAPSVYIANGLHPPIDQLNDVAAFSRTLRRTTKKRTITSIVGWVSLVALVSSLAVAALFLLFECMGGAPHSETCGWSVGLFPLTTGMFFIVAWPVCFAIAMAVWWWKDSSE